jgi:hypothetical protein
LKHEERNPPLDTLFIQQHVLATDLTIK